MIRASLLGLVVNGVLLAESAILLHLETVGVILLVLHGVVVSLLALRASQSDFYAHNGTSLNTASLYHPAQRKFRKRSTTNYRPGLKKAHKKSPFSQVKTFYHGGRAKSTIFSSIFGEIVV
jgi:hypothetical protein